MILKNISNMPARVKCALLAWHTLDDVLKNWQIYVFIVY
jgi:nitrogen fixation NifU-like protein